MRPSPPSKQSILNLANNTAMLWIIEESEDCGVHWRRAELTYCCLHPQVALLEALAIVEDEWRPPQRAFQELTSALQHELTAYYWEKAIRVVRTAMRRRAHAGAA